LNILEWLIEMNSIIFTIGAYNYYWTTQAARTEKFLLWLLTF